MKNEIKTCDIRILVPFNCQILLPIRLALSILKNISRIISIQKHGKIYNFRSKIQMSVNTENVVSSMQKEKGGC